MKNILFKIFHSIKNENYVIIKLPQNFPKQFKSGSDLDILCENNDKILKKIMQTANNSFLVSSKNELKIFYLSQNHTQVDFCIQKKFYLNLIFLTSLKI